MPLPTMKIGNLFFKKAIIQGGMGVGISLSSLATAVAKCGGGGTIAAAGIGYQEKDFSRNYVEANNRALAKHIQQACEKTHGNIGVNIMVALTNYPELMETAIKNRADYIISGAGLPMDMPKYLLPSSQTKLIPIIASAKGAKVIGNRWLGRYNRLPDAFVVEGPEAGGHLGYSADQINDHNHSLEVVIPEVVEEVRKFESYGEKIPIIAAGGIYTGADIYKFLKLGASGVQMATRLVTTEECDADIAFKMAYINAQKEDIAIIESPVKMIGRAIINAFLRAVKRGEKKPSFCPYHCIKSCDRKNSPYCIIQALVNARNGNLNDGFAFASTNAYRAKRIYTVKEVFDQLESEYDAEVERNP